MVRPVDLVEDGKAREELRSKGRRFVVSAGARRFDAAVQAGLETVPCIVRELNDKQAMILSIAENKHRKDIPAEKWIKILRNLYNRYEGAKIQRTMKMAEETGMGESSIREYLLLDNLPDDFKSLLKEPEERSFSEKEALKKIALAHSGEKAPIGKRSKEGAPRTRRGPPWNIPCRSRSSELGRLAALQRPKYHSSFFFPTSLHLPAFLLRRRTSKA